MNDRVSEIARLTAWERAKVSGWKGEGRSGWLKRKSAPSPPPPEAPLMLTCLGWRRRRRRRCRQWRWLTPVYSVVRSRLDSPRLDSPRLDLFRLAATCCDLLRLVATSTASSAPATAFRVSNCLICMTWLKRGDGFWDRRFEKFFFAQKFMREMFKAKGKVAWKHWQAGGVCTIYMCVFV